jgi:phage tail-like protein
MPDPATVTYSLELGGVSLGFFRRVVGIESQTEIIEVKQSGPDGRMVIRKLPGATKWADITLERRLDATRALWDWRNEVVEGNFDQARRDGAVVALDESGSEIARWSFTSGWPSAWRAADLDVGTDDGPTESVTITHEGLVRP